MLSNNIGTDHIVLSKGVRKPLIGSTWDRILTSPVRRHLSGKSARYLLEIEREMAIVDVLWWRTMKRKIFWRELELLAHERKNRRILIPLMKFRISSLFTKLWRKKLSLENKKMHLEYLESKRAASLNAVTSSHCFASFPYQRKFTHSTYFYKNKYSFLSR